MEGVGKVLCQWSIVECGRVYPAVDKAGAKAKVCVKQAPTLQIRMHLKTWPPNLLIVTPQAQIGWVGLG